MYYITCTAEHALNNKHSTTWSALHALHNKHFKTCTAEHSLHNMHNMHCPVKTAMDYTKTTFTSVKLFINFAPGACNINLFTAVIHFEP